METSDDNCSSSALSLLLFSDEEKACLAREAPLGIASSSVVVECGLVLPPSSEGSVQDDGSWSGLLVEKACGIGADEELAEEPPASEPC